jgi:subtilisin family serine protease
MTTAAVPIDIRALRAAGASLSAVALVAAVLALAGATPPTSSSRESFIVRATPSSLAAAESAVRDAGGNVGLRLPIVDGFVANMSSSAVMTVNRVPGVYSVTANAPLHLNSLLDGWDQGSDLGSMQYVAQAATGASAFWNAGITGRGVDVALIDSGVVPVNGLRTAGKVLQGPDLSFESQIPNLRYLDTFGHGTHMAGIIAGRDDATPASVRGGEQTFVGIAPDARIISLKVADSRGATDLSQVIGAIDWVVQHRNKNGLNIRVLNLSFGTDGEQDYRIDPLTYAVEVAWRSGIAVVVSAGNGGFGSTKLNDPAYDPFVIAVGAADTQGTADWKDDIVPTWSSWGDGTRNPDLVAPGRSIVSLRAPGSNLDRLYPTARVGVTPRFFRGSGTSEAAAVVSGAAALIIQQRPTITPDQLKALLRGTANRLWKADLRGQGAGLLDLAQLRDHSTPANVDQLWTRATGMGSLELARGSAHVTENGIPLSGERDIFGAPWNASPWAQQLAAGTSWSGGVWRGNTWTGNTWTGNTWSSAVWTGNTWTGNTWSGNTWSGNTWSGNTWSGNTWSGNTWTGNTWSGNTWSGNTWSGVGWGW